MTVFWILSLTKKYYWQLSVIKVVLDLWLDIIDLYDYKGSEFITKTVLIYVEVKISRSIKGKLLLKDVLFLPPMDPSMPGTQSNQLSQ